jgi:hypothetical protein
VASEAEAVAGLVVLGSQVANPAGGFLASYDLTAFYDAVAQGTLTLPCALALEDLKDVFNWEATSGQGNGRTQAFKMMHELLFKEVAGNADFPALLPSERQLVKNYELALDANPYLSNPAPTIHFAPKVHGELAYCEWKQRTYFGVVMTYEARINL